MKTKLTIIRTIDIRPEVRHSVEKAPAGPGLVTKVLSALYRFWFVRY